MLKLGKTIPNEKDLDKEFVESVTFTVQQYLQKSARK